MTEPHAVGADDEVGFNLGAVGEGEHHAVVPLLDPNQTMVQVDQAGIKCARQKLPASRRGETYNTVLRNAPKFSVGH